MHAYVQTMHVDERLVPPVQEWQLLYCVLSNNSIHLASYDPYADQDGQKQVYGKFQRVLTLGSVELEFLEHGPSPTGFVIQLLMEDYSKALYICPDAIKSLLEWGSVLQHAMDRLNGFTKPLDEAEIAEKVERKNPTGTVEVARFAVCARGATVSPPHRSFATVCDTVLAGLADPKSWAADYRNKMRSRRKTQRMRV